MLKYAKAYFSKILGMLPSFFLKILYSENPCFYSYQISKNKKLLEKCKTLREYMIYVTKVREYAVAMNIQTAVECAVNECIKQGILREFLLRYKAGAIQMSIFEYDEEREMQLIKESMRQVYSKEGREEGEELFAMLTEKLLKDAREQELLRAVNDMKFRKELYKEYGIKGE